MPSTYTTNLGLEKPATGEQAGVWGTKVNLTFDFLDQGIDGNITIPLSASAYTLLTNQGTPSDGRNKVIVFTGALASEGSISISPNTAEKIYFVTNQTTGGFALNFSQGTGPVFKLLAGRSAIIYSNGLGGPAGVVGALADHQVNSLLVQTNLIVQGQVQWGAPAVFNQPATFQGLATFQSGVTIQPPATINLGSDAPYDLYYRSAGGPLARLPIGSSGQALTVTGAGPTWSTVQTTINMVIVGSAPQQVFFANNASQMVQDPNFQWVPGTGLGIGMAPQRALSIGRGLPAAIQLDAVGNPPASRGLLITTSNQPRWSLETSGDSEAGGNTGSNLMLRSVNDAGSVVTVNFASYRSGRSSFGLYNDTYNAQLAVVNTTGSGYIQTWANGAGTVVASIDSSGLFSSVASSGFLKLDANKRLDINGSVSGHPLSTVHIGPDTVVGPPNPSITFEGAVGAGNAGPSNTVRLYFRTTPNLKAVIQFNVGGTAYYAALDLVADSSGSPHSWFITNTAQ
jgi:hypothetical protein